jgi:hypothetical protein
MTVEPMSPRLEKLIAKLESELVAGRVSKPCRNAEDFLANLKQ